MWGTGVQKVPADQRGGKPKKQLPGWWRVATEVSVCIVSKRYWASKNSLGWTGPLKAIWSWGDASCFPWLLPLAMTHTLERGSAAGQFSLTLHLVYSSWTIQPHSVRNQVLESLSSWPIDATVRWELYESLGNKTYQNENKLTERVHSPGNAKSVCVRVYTRVC